MKNNVVKLILLFCLFGYSSCDENSPVIPCLSCEDEQVSITPTDKKVLIEEFTGVRCVNCPAGSAEIENLLDIHGAQLIAVSIHAGFFSTPYANSNEDYTIPEGTALESFLDSPLGYPTAVIDRKLFENQDDRQLTQSAWAGLIQQEKGQLSPLVLELSLDFNESSRQLTATSIIQPAETITGDYRYSVMVVETDIIDVQLTPAGEQDDYVHKHVLRDMITPFDGESIDEDFIVGTTVEKVHQMILPDNYNSSKVSVIVIIHETGGSSREVVQVEQKSLAS